MSDEKYFSTILFCIYLLFSNFALPSVHLVIEKINMKKVVYLNLEEKHDLQKYTGNVKRRDGLSTKVMITKFGVQKGDKTIDWFCFIQSASS